MNTRFEYADKQKMQEILPVLFDILHSNMSIIAPTGNTYENDMEQWLSNVLPAMQKEVRQIVLMYADDKLVGYFQYYVNSGALMMEEIQIASEYQGSGLFGLFYRWLVKVLPKDIKYVEAYSNKKNHKSQAILEHLGLSKVGENKNGNSFYYKGDYVILLNRYN
ncbi:MAG: hypothetical protein IJF40_01475 [Clostridia bacterium]|nr:hypothetical protein [Clostridia bacterium]